MGDIAEAPAERSHEEKTETARSRRRILRYDEVYDPNEGQFRHIKTAKPPESRKRAGRHTALVVRRLMDARGFPTKTEVDMPSKHIATAMREINADVEGLSLNKTPPTVPLETFFHCRSDLQKKLDTAKAASTPDPALITDLALAAQFAVDEFVETRANFDTLLEAGEMTWALLWTILKPNCLIYRKHPLLEEDQVLKLLTITEVKKPFKTPFWKLSCCILADDGVKFGLAHEPFYMTILEFPGTRKITDLPMYPLEYHEEFNEVCDRALQRGRRIASLKGAQLMETSGSAMCEKVDLMRTHHVYRFSAQGKTVIDPEKFQYFNPNCVFTPEVYKAVSRTDLTEEELMIATPVALGFCLANNKWGAFAMGRLQDVKWNDRVFEDLVVDDPRKILLRAMFKQHSSNDDSFDDIVSGKGKGIVCLFSGPPGCGKTLTAEAIAELTKRPLYRLSAGDLGVQPETLDQNLARTLELCHKWDAVLLLDEAEVFLQKRTPDDVRRNALVSIFLRQLEYFQGILILTTNEVAQCDPAFESRVHIPMVYPELNEQARRKIWSMFVRRLQETGPTGVAVSAVDITEAEVGELAKLEVNGRQIKNMLNSARIMAKEMGEPLAISHLRMVLSIIMPQVEKQLREPPGSARQEVVVNGCNGHVKGA